MNDSVSLQPFDRQALPRLARWLAQPHVAPWFPEPDANLEWAAQPPAGASQALICDAGRAVGWLRWQRVSRDALDSLGFHDIPTNSVDADILLGEPASVGHAVGVTALRCLIARLRDDGDVPMVGLTTNVANTRAHRAFERAGFRIDRQYDPNGFGPCHLMLLDLRAANAAQSGAAVSIGVASPNEFAEVRALIAAGLARRWGRYDATRNADLREFAATYREAPVVVARTAGGTIIGCGILVPEAPGVARIVRMSIADAWQRRGIGARVLSELIDRARTRGVGEILLETTADWDSAVAFYRRHGFIESHRAGGDVHFRYPLHAG